MKTIAIIGAGAAGLMAAATILESDGSPDFHIHLFEKNSSPGKKVIISGGGRCNVTTSIDDKKILASKYTRGWEFIKKSIGKFSSKKCYDWFEGHGVPLKIQEDLRVFPVSDDGRDIVGVFENIFAKNRDKINLHYAEGVDNLKKNGEKYQITTSKGVYEIDILIITTGGNAYSHTGSTGDGYAFARDLGHTVTELGPSLSSFLTVEGWLHALSGLAFEDARVTFYPPLEKGESEGVLFQKLEQTPPNLPFSGEGGDKKTLTGPLLLTHFGISGPLTFMVSSELAWEMIDQKNPKTIFLSPISSMGFAEWEIFLKGQFQSHPKKIIVNILIEKLSRRFAEAFISEYLSHISDTFVGSISKIDREIISRLLGEGIPITLLERRPGDEFVTAGGVSTDELDPETMQSKIREDLYFAGEVLNVDGYTGGFSLQICWSSGYAAGRDIARKLAEGEKSI